MDYDVEAIGLASPPATASLTTYRPAITVRNNGTHPAIATGNLQAYMAGLRVWSSSVESGTIAPGATGLATSLTDWKPDSQGDYVLFGYITTLRDQVEPNNNLAPVKIHVGPEPPVPPPTVPAHVEQHESGGSDELFVEGLQGQLADDQPTLPHASKHQSGGSDQLNVSGLSGVLGEPQQPLDHGNESHTTPFASSAELTAHQNAASVHTAAINLANRDISGPLTGLVPSAQIANLTESPPNARQALLSGRGWGYPKQAALGSNQAKVTVLQSSGETTILEKLIPAAWISDDMQFLLQSHTFATAPSSAGGFIMYTLYLGNIQIAQTGLDVIGSSTRIIFARGTVIGLPTSRATGALELLGSPIAPFQDEWTSAFDTTYPQVAQSDHLLRITAEITSGDPLMKLEAFSGFIRALHPIP